MILTAKQHGVHIEYDADYSQRKTLVIEDTQKFLSNYEEAILNKIMEDSEAQEARELLLVIFTALDQQRKSVGYWGLRAKRPLYQRRDRAEYDSFLEFTIGDIELDGVRRFIGDFVESILDLDIEDYEVDHEEPEYVGE